MSEKDKKPNRADLNAAMNGLRRKIAKTKPKDPDGTTVHENLTGEKKESKVNRRYKGHHRSEE